MKCSWAPGWCWSQAKGNTERERERRLTQAEMWGWRLTGCWGFAVRELPLGASQPTVSEQGAAAQRGSGKATNTQDKTKHRDDWDLFYFELTLFLKHCCRVTSWFFVWLKLRQRFQLGVDFVSFDLFWISIPVCLHALCVCLWKSSSVWFFVLFFLCMGKGIVLWDLYQYFVI